MFGGWLRNVDDEGMETPSLDAWSTAAALAATTSRLEDYSVSNRGLRAGLVGTPELVAERIRQFEQVGVDLLLLQFSPQLEEMERFAEEVIPLVDGAAIGPPR